MEKLILEVKIKDDEGKVMTYHVKNDVWQERLDAAKDNPELAKQVLADIAKSAETSDADARVFSISWE